MILARIAAAIVSLSGITDEQAQPIAEAVHAVACPEGETAACVRHAAALVAIGYLESGFRSSVALGHVKGDNGRSWGFWQINCGRAKSCERFLDLDTGAAEALRLVLLSEGACRKHGREAALRAYASGSCGKGARESRERVRLWFRVEGMLWASQLS